MRKYVAGIAVVVTVLFLSPFLIGIWLQYQYASILATYAATRHLSFEIKDYQRHWASSDVAVLVTIPRSEWQSISRQLGMQVVPSDSSDIYFVIHQHIQHGPIFFKNGIIPSRFGWIAMHNELELSPELAKAFGMKELSGVVNDTLITYLGNYFTYWRLKGLQVVLAANKSIVKTGQVTAHVWFQPKEGQMRGRLSVAHIEMRGKNKDMVLSKVDVAFNHHQVSNGLWLGQYELRMPKLTYHWGDDDSIILSGVNVKSATDESGMGMLKGERRFDVDQIQWNDQMVGPLHVRLTLQDLNLQPVADLVDIYQSTLRAGELYEGQLSRRIYAKLPNLINRDSRIQLTQFSLMTPKGALLMTGEVNWQALNFLDVNDFSDVTDTAYATLKMHFPKALMNPSIWFFGQLPYYKGTLSVEARKQVIEAQHQVDFALHKNGVLLDQMIDSHILSEDMAFSLYNMQQSLEPREVYARFVKTLLFNKQITQAVSYELMWQYDQIDGPYSVLVDINQAYQHEAEEDVRQEFADWVRQGFVIESGDQSYTVSLIWSNGELAGKQKK